MLDESTLYMLLQGVGESLYMTLVSTLFAYVIGLPIGIFLVTSCKDGIHPSPWLFKTLDVIVNLTRSIPFLILLVAIMPFTRLVTGTTIGSTATIVPLTLSAAPFVARLVESSLKEVDQGVIEAAQSMGASNFQIVWKVLLPEARPSLLVGAAIAVTTILGYSAMAGFVGGGGLGTIAINYGYYRYQNEIMLITVVLLVLIVQIFQKIGMQIAMSLDRRKQ
ncbi:MAG: D-methionine ABC transporter permease protein MetI [Thermocaproicibacter melissae]|jgi:D-methionine transport system permease protein|uniref:methionine ABC transporter permease n=1 Tax=Thermocaproicibacter melissae TaxID=2966552 RepID=UPI0024B1A1B5|nr:methionine ABC transporter permease [Thermocaproicibacter melissae]WBY64992.1 ABC transporter permease [Thermocaproicibacter melissae]